MAVRRISSAPAEVNTFYFVTLVPSCVFAQEGILLLMEVKQDA